MYSKPTKKKDHKAEPFTNVGNGKGTLPMNDNLVLQPSIAYPENFVVPVMDLEPQSDSLIIGKGLVYNITSGNVYSSEVIKQDGYRLFGLRCDPAKKYFAEFGGTLCLVRSGLLPVIKFTENGAALYVLMAYITEPKDITMSIQGEKYKLTGWSDKTSSYAKAVKEDSMPLDLTKLNLPNITEDQIASALGTSVEDMKASGIDINTSASEQRAKEKAEPRKQTAKSAETKKEAPAEAAAAEPVPDQPKEVKDEAAVEEAKEERPVEKAVQEASDSEKKTRRRAPKAAGRDLTEVIEALGADVPDDLIMEDVVKEIRQIRDLMLAASRRSANLALHYLTKGAATETALKQIKELLQC